MLKWLQCNLCLNDTIEKITTNGGSIISEIMTVPDIGLLAYFKDVEGVINSILESFPQPN